MLRAGTLDLHINQGANFTLPLALETGAPPQPWDLTGCTLAGQIRRRANSPNLDATLTCEVTDAAAGKVSLSLTPAETAALRADGRTAADTAPYVWDLLLTDADGKVRRILQGAATVSPRVTQ